MTLMSRPFMRASREKFGIDRNDPNLALYVPFWYPGMQRTAPSLDINRHVSTPTGVVWGNQGGTFDGVDDVITIAPHASINNIAALTAMAWIKLVSVGEGAGRILHKAASASNAVGWYLTTQGTNVISFACDSGASTLERTSDNNMVTLNVWQHIALTWDGSMTAANIHIYVNDVECTYATTTNGTARVDDAASSLYIGNRGDTERTANGIIGEVVWYNRVLSAAERAHHRSATQWRYV